MISDVSEYEQYALATNHVSPGAIETLNSWLIPTAQNWNELTQLLVGPKPKPIVLSPSRWFFAVAPTTMKVLLHSAQSTIALGTNSHDTQFTLDPSDIPTARDQNELARLFAAPSAYRGNLSVRKSDFLKAQGILRRIFLNFKKAQGTSGRIFLIPRHLEAHFLIS